MKAVYQTYLKLQKSVRFLKVVINQNSLTIAQFQSYLLFQKYLKKIVYIRLHSYLSKNAVLCQNQFGFRSNYSTAYAVLQMVDKITEAVENNQFAAGIFIDLSKTFDTLDHNILLNKLNFYGI